MRKNLTIAYSLVLIILPLMLTLAVMLSPIIELDYNKVFFLIFTLVISLIASGINWYFNVIQYSDEQPSQHYIKLNKESSDSQPRILVPASEYLTLLTHEYLTIRDGNSKQTLSEWYNNVDTKIEEVGKILSDYQGFKDEN